MIPDADNMAERHRVEAELRHRAEQFETLVHQSPVGIYIVDNDFRITQVNPIARPVFGDIPDLIGRDFDNVIHILWEQSYADELTARFRHTLETGEPYETPARTQFRVDRGLVEYYAWRVDRIMLADGRYGVVCYFSDISDQVRAHLTIAQSEKKYRELFERIDEGFCIIEMIFDGETPVDYRFLEVNPAFERQSDIVDAPGRLMRDIAPEHEQHWFDRYGTIALTGQAQRFEAPVRVLGNRYYDINAFRIGETEQRRVAVVFNDITRRQRDAETLRENAERLNLLVAELQHRTRNLLSVVSGIADQTRETSATLDDFGLRFDRRLAALGRVQGLLSIGPLPSITLPELLGLELDAHGIDPDGGASIGFAGPDVALPADTVQLLALALHELTTNALKHGAFAARGGLDIAWAVRGMADGNRLLSLRWTESGVPKADGEVHRGFGRQLIEVDLPYELDATTRLEFGPDGVTCLIEVALPPEAR